MADTTPETGVTPESEPAPTETLQPPAGSPELPLAGSSGGCCGGHHCGCDL
jgi:hypothetical protein